MSYSLRWASLLFFWDSLSWQNGTFTYSTTKPEKLLMQGKLFSQYKTMENQRQHVIVFTALAARVYNLHDIGLFYWARTPTDTVYFVHGDHQMRVITQTNSLVLQIFVVTSFGFWAMQILVIVLFPYSERASHLFGFKEETEFYLREKICMGWNSIS